MFRVFNLKCTAHFQFVPAAVKEITSSAAVACYDLVTKFPSPAQIPRCIILQIAMLIFSNLISWSPIQFKDPH